MMRRLAIVGLGLMLTGLQYRLWIGDGGVYDTARQRMVLKAQETENTKLQRRNAALDAEVEDLRAGGAAIEAHARTTLGMIRRGESFFLVVEPDSSLSINR